MIGHRVLERRELSDGRGVWIQRTKIPGVRKAALAVVTSSNDPLEGPAIVHVPNTGEAYRVLGDIIRADVLEAGA